MRILSFNVNNAPQNAVTRINEVISLIEKLNPDIISLQEVLPQMYIELINQLRYKYYISEQPANNSYFTVLLSKFSYPITYKSFRNSTMGRGYIIHNLPNLTIVCTHLDSLPISELIRKKQIAELLEIKNNNNNNNIIIFGDLNFTNPDETIKELKYLEPINKNMYTYDSLYNRNAVYPFRTNLDRFYTNIGNRYQITILTGIKTSDHFPVVLDIFSGI